MRNVERSQCLQLCNYIVYNFIFFVFYLKENFLHMGRQLYSKPFTSFTQVLTIFQCNQYSLSSFHLFHTSKFLLLKMLVLKYEKKISLPKTELFEYYIDLDLILFNYHNTCEARLCSFMETQLYSNLPWPIMSLVPPGHQIPTGVCALGFLLLGLKKCFFKHVRGERKERKINGCPRTWPTVEKWFYIP